MIGAFHARHILHCLRSKAAKDLKSNDAYAAVALHRLRLGRECERIIQLIREHDGQIETHEVARALGWQPPLTLFGTSVNAAAQEWLNQRFADSTEKD